MLLLAVLALVGAVASEPQAVMPFSYSMMAHHVSPVIHEPITALHDPLKLMSHSILPNMYPYSILPSYEMKSLLPKPVEDTPEVKLAKANFALEYQKALMGMHDTTVVRAKRDLRNVMPMRYNMPVMSNSYMMPYSTHMTSPWMTNLNTYGTPIVHY